MFCTICFSYLMKWWDGLYDMYNTYQAEKAQGSFAEVLPKSLKAKFIISRVYVNHSLKFSGWRGYSQWGISSPFWYINLFFCAVLPPDDTWGELTFDLRFVFNGLSKLDVVTCYAFLIMWTNISALDEFCSLKFIS